MGWRRKIYNGDWRLLNWKSFGGSYILVAPISFCPETIGSLLSSFPGCGKIISAEVNENEANYFFTSSLTFKEVAKRIGEELGLESYTPRKRSRKKMVIGIKDGETKTWESCTAVARDLGCQQSEVSENARGIRTFPVKGWQFNYL